jgi:hypothetical protein
VLAEFGALWLGWDSVRGQSVAHPDVGDLDVAAITATPRKYGLHGTLKAPFRLQGSIEALQDTAARFAQTQAPVPLHHMTLRHDSGFVALRPMGEVTALNGFASDIVRAFDPHRAPLSEADIARRRQSKLSPRQDRQMLDWGYPFIFDDFHFHLTLSGRLDAQVGAEVIAALDPLLTPLVPNPMMIDEITLMGEDIKGMFHQLHHYALTG